MARPDSSAEAINPPSCAGLGGFYFDGLHLGGISSQHGIPFFSKQGREWIQQRAGSVPVIWSHSARSQGDKDGHWLPTCVEGSWELPDRPLVEEYFRIFFRSALRYVFPIIDDTSFGGIVDRAYDSRRDKLSPEAIRARACVLSFTAVLIHMEGKLDPDQHVDDEQCAARAERLMPQILAEVNSESLQVCTMLVSLPITEPSPILG